MAAGTASVVWQWRSESTGARWLTGVLVAATWWSAVAVLELLAVDLGAKIRFSQLRYLGIIAAPLCFAEFTHRYVNHGQPLPRRGARPLRALAGLLLLIVFSQPWHRLRWSEVSLVDRTTLVTAHYKRALFFWIVIVYAYGILLTGAFTLARHSFTVVGCVQGMLIVGATLAPLASSLVYLFRLGPLPELDPAPLGFVVTGLLLSWAAHRVRRSP